MEKIKKCAITHREWILWMLAFLLGVGFIFKLHTLDWAKEFQYDAAVYWYDGMSYNLEKFSIYNYTNSLRGYLYPLLLYCVQKLAYIGIGGDRLYFFITSSLLYAFFFMVLMPKIIKLMFEIDMSISSRLIYSIICTVMLKGLILYPLTDLFGVMLVCAAIYLFLLLMKNKIRAKWMQGLCAGGIGVALGGGVLCSAGLSHSVDCVQWFYCHLHDQNKKMDLVDRNIWNAACCNAASMYQSGTVWYI